MLFDIQGKRRRVVQATYLTLAVLMGGGLVLFGIGGEVSGGLFDAFSSGNGGNGSDVVEERVERNEKRVEARPRDVAARQELVRDYYSLAFAAGGEGNQFSEDAKDELEKASTHWKAYLELSDGKPNASTTRVALQIYDPTALDQPENALEAARILAQRTNDPSGYLQLAQYAVLANDKRTQKLAADKARDLARDKEERRAVDEQLGQLAAQQLQQEQLNEQVKQGDLKIQPDGQGNQGPAKK